MPTFLAHDRHHAVVPLVKGMEMRRDLRSLSEGPYAPVKCGYEDR